MSNGGGSKKAFGRASVSLAAITLMIFGPIATARAESEIDELLGPSAAKISNAELAEQRGGFMVKGVKFNIAVDKMKTVDGELEYASHLVADHHGWTQSLYEKGNDGFGVPNGVGNAHGHSSHQDETTTANAGSTAPGTLPPITPVPTVSDPVIALGDASLATSNPGGSGGGIPQSTTPVSVTPPPEITGGVELAVESMSLPSAPPLPDMTSTAADIAPAGGDSGAPQIFDAAPPEATLIPPVTPPEAPDVILPTTAPETSHATAVLPAPSPGDVPSANTTTGDGPGIASTPQSAGTPVASPWPHPQKVQVLVGNQTLTNEMVQHLLYGPTVVVNDQNNVVIQEFTSITVDITNFSSIYADAFHGQLAASIADLIRTQITTSLSGF